VELVNKASIIEESVKKNAMTIIESRKKVAPPLNRNQVRWKCRLNGDNQGAKLIENRLNSANGTPCPRCQCPHNGSCHAGTNICHRCGQAGHFVQDCLKNKGGAASLQAGNIHRPPTQARVYALTPSEAEAENGVVTGTLPLFTSKAVILFDSGATHSFILTKHARRFHINLEPMEVGVVVSTPVGKSVICSKLVKGCPIHIEGRTLTTNLIVFDIEGFDIKQSCYH
jgi:hypothetical protein